MLATWATAKIGLDIRVTATMVRFFSGGAAGYVESGVASSGPGCSSGLLGCLLPRGPGVAGRRDAESVGESQEQAVFYVFRAGAIGCCRAGSAGRMQDCPLSAGVAARMGPVADLTGELTVLPEPDAQAFAA